MPGCALCQVRFLHSVVAQCPPTNRIIQTPAVVLVNALGDLLGEPCMCVCPLWWVGWRWPAGWLWCGGGAKGGEGLEEPWHGAPPRGPPTPQLGPLVSPPWATMVHTAAGAHMIFSAEA